jgi:curved DNA-binding protein CbpA
MLEIQDDYYQILGVAEDAAPDDIRKAYLKLAKKLHPDRFPNDPEKKSAAQAEFARVTRAHEVLGDSRQKDEYDTLRTLARNRAALDTGMPGGAGVGVDPAISQKINAEQQRESKESWAAKHSQRAQDCYQKKQYQEAETAIKEAIRLSPDKVKYHLQLAEVYLARGWKTLAQTESQAALRLDPNDTDAKSLDSRLKMGSATGKQAAGSKPSAPAEKKSGGGFLDSLNKLLGKKKA